MNPVMQGGFTDAATAFLPFAVVGLSAAVLSVLALIR